MYKYNQRIRDFLEKDLFKEIGNFYKNINPVYRHSFWILFVVTNLIFGFHTINFFWGHHDWSNFVNGTAWNKSFYEARYGAFIMSQILTGNLYLPIISSLWAYAALSLSAVLLAVYWKVPQKTSYFVIFGLVLNITPYTCEWVFFGHWTVNMFFARLFIITGFVLSDKVYALSALKSKIVLMILSILFMNFGLSIYTSMLCTFVMVIVGRILVEILEWKSVVAGVKNTIKYNCIAYINTILAAIIYLIIIAYMKSIHIVQSQYNMETTPLTEMPKKVILCIKSAWQQFTDWSMPFYPNTLTKLFFALAVIFMGQILLSSKSKKIKIIICATFILSLFLTKTTALISQITPIYTVRVEFCGYVLFNALIVALSLKIEGILQSLKVLISCIIIYIFAINNVYMQRTWKMGFDSEVMMYNRMQARVENNPNFNPAKKYTVLQLGATIASRKNFYPNVNHSYNPKNLLAMSIAYPWQTWSIPSFYNPGYVKKCYKVNYDYLSDPLFMRDLRRLYDTGLLENAKAWPANNSIIVYDDIILVITDENILQKAKDILAKKKQKELAIKAKARTIATTEPQAEAK